MKPKNWDNFQHYKDRCPPWIKLHKELLNDRSFMTLPTASKALAPLLWLLASESKDGEFDASIDELEFRLRMTRKELESGLKALIDKGFFVDGSNVLAECVQGAIPETETETETEIEIETEAKAATVVAPPDGVSKEVWQEFAEHRKRKKARVSKLVITGIQREAEKAGWTLEQALSETVVRGWASFKAEWVAEKKNYTQQAADIARSTVPSKPGIDPVLARINQDREAAKPMPEHIRAQIKQALGK